MFADISDLWLIIINCFVFIETWTDYRCHAAAASAAAAITTAGTTFAVMLLFFAGGVARSRGGGGVSNIRQASMEEGPGVEDLIVLTHLHEPAILYSLEERYNIDIIYTYTGPILLAINPFWRVPLWVKTIGLEIGIKKKKLSLSLFLPVGFSLGLVLSWAYL